MIIMISRCGLMRKKGGMSMEVLQECRLNTKHPATRSSAFIGKMNTYLAKSFPQIVPQ